MVKKTLMIGMLSLGFMLWSLGSSAQVVVRVKPVARKVVVVKPARPSAAHVWIDGQWKWNRKKKEYVWIKGHWVKRKAGKKWVPGHWQKVRRGYKWIPGHWA